jgi:NAD(P)-dependent dehydrogenase (short-subunit alcohol dehydrogenase family)
MPKTILITGSTDGIGLEAAKALYAQGHHVLLHGRSSAKLEAADRTLSELAGDGRVESYLADLSRMANVEVLAQAIAETHERLDVVINNAGILRTTDTFTDDGLDSRFAVNTFAPYLLTQRLLPLLQPGARVVNLSSAAQSPVNLEALAGRTKIPDQLNAYAQSKLALTMWSRAMADVPKGNGLVFVAVNPGSLLATKMVKEGFGMAGSDIRIGSDILIRAALSDEFAKASGLYFDNDKGRFAAPHPDALDLQRCKDVVGVIDAFLAEMGQSGQRQV